MKKLFVGLVFGVSCSLGFAQTITPAHKLLDEVFYLLDSFYDGYQTVDVGKLRAEFMPKIDAICADKDLCEAKEAHSVIVEMLNSLGEGHISWNPDSILSPNAETDTKQEDLGLKVTLSDEVPKPIITRVYPNSAADKAGLVPGNTILSINNFDLTGKNVDEISEIYQQVLKTGNITFSVRKNDGTIQKVDLVPAIISQNWLPYLHFNGCVAIIEIENYLNLGTAQQFHKLINLAKDKKACGLVIDDRNNPGGLEDNALAITTVFTKKKIEDSLLKFKNSVATLSIDENGVTKNEISGEIASYLSENMKIILKNQNILELTDKADWNANVVILVNGQSVSAAEYLPYFLQKYAREKICIIGESTFGVLNTGMAELSLLDGSFLYMTGRSIWKDGESFPERVMPDIEIEEDLDQFTKGNDQILQSGLKIAQSGQCSL